MNFFWIVACLLAAIYCLFQGTSICQTAGCVLQYLSNNYPTSRRATNQETPTTGSGNIRRLIPHINIKASLGKITSIEVLNHQRKDPSSLPSLLVRIDDISWPFPSSLTRLKANRRRDSVKTRKYVYVLSFWEQLSGSIISLLDLSLLNQFTGRKVVMPKVNNSFVGSSGQNLHSYFNVSQLNRLLKNNGVSALVKEQEFFKECGANSGQENLTVHFLYTLHLNSYATRNAGIATVEQSMDKLKEKAWIECAISRSKHARQEVCVNSLNVYRTDFLENEIFQNAKCVVISEWRGLGDAKLRLKLQPSPEPLHSLFLQTQLELNENIFKEAKLFVEETYQGATFVAVHVRAEWLLAPQFKAIEMISLCMEVLKEAVTVLTYHHGVRHVFLFTDFNKHGSSTYPDNILNKLKVMQKDLVKSLNATCFRPNRQSKPFLSDRGVVALIEMSISSRSNHLVTLGRGTFQDWVLTRFLKNNRGQGSLLRICSRTHGQR